ncbi:hypothetical protein EDB81DRAFT_429060 [Dactylonectria macrodidyma]|uniref:Uncharacterized protein n=1 Tax=Dactylonectria macrodidyma TaxID=307937 RepID=A0A9P9I763_9HYPO|nr:hypothetical protein EDB81DRAFT_429060 [Dactylonectria macrodidyma]
MHSCIHCREHWFDMKRNSLQICSRCIGRDRERAPDEPYFFSATNNLDFGEVPGNLPDLTFLQAKNHGCFGGSWTLVNAHGSPSSPAWLPPWTSAPTTPRIWRMTSSLFSASGCTTSSGTTNGTIADSVRARRRRRRRRPRMARGGRLVPYGGVYKGPGVTTQERQTWREEMRKGNSIDSLADGNAPGRSQP